MKLSKITLVVAIALVAIVALSVSASAYTKEDLATYITSPQKIGGTTYKLTDADAVAAKEYIMTHNISDAEANRAKDLISQAVSKAGSASSLDQLSSATKSEITSLLQQAGDAVGATVSVNTNSKTVSVVGEDGTAIINGSYASNGNGGLTISSNPTGATTGSAAGASSSAAAGTASNGGSSTFVYTGANNAVFAVVALLAVVAVSTVLVKKAYAK